METLLSPVKKSLLQLYQLKRTKREGAEYDGYLMHYSVAATSLPPNENLSKEGLEYSSEQGRDPLDVILGIAFQLGYSNAKVSDSSQNDYILSKLDSIMEKIGKS